MRAAATVVILAFCAASSFAQKATDSNYSPPQVSELRWKADSQPGAEGPPLSESNAEIAKPGMVVATAVAKALPSTPTAQTPQGPIISERQRKIWYTLLTVDHSAAAFDAWTTRQVLSTGGRELDPLVRPFAHSPSLYPALQVAPLGMDYLGAKLMRSQNPAIRRLWWVPQTVAAAGSLLCGTMNLPNRR